VGDLKASKGNEPGKADSLFLFNKNVKICTPLLIPAGQ